MIDSLVQPLISIIVNCYNGGEFLSKALDSIKNQTYSNWEVIFWDNCSTDRSSEIFNSYSLNDIRFKYFLAPVHTILYEARNFAVGKSNGEFIAFLDVDDWWTINKLETQIQCFKNEKIGLVCSSYYLFNIRNGKSTNKLIGPFPSGDVISDLISNYFIHISTLMIKRDAINKLSYICDPRFNIIGDLDLVIRLMQNWELHSIEEPLAYYRWHNNNTGYITNYQISDELKIWVLENKSKFEHTDYFSKIESKAFWYEIVKSIYDDKKFYALKLSYKLPFLKFIKVVLALMLPNKIIRKYI